MRNTILSSGLNTTILSFISINRHTYTLKNNIADKHKIILNNFALFFSATDLTPLPAAARITDDNILLFLNQNAAKPAMPLTFHSLHMIYPL